MIVQEQPRSDDPSIWALTAEWMARVDKAYTEYTEMLRRVLWSALLAGCALLLVLLSFFFLEGMKKNFPEDSFFRGDLASIIFILMMFVLAMMIILYLANWFRQVSALRSELADMHHIAQELFQMVISSEEKNTASKYEYLVNHVRILEIRHLLKKVERVLGKTQSAHSS